MEAIRPHALPDASYGRVRLRTLVNIRWIAVVGQAVTLTLVHYALDFRLPYLAAMVVVGLSVALNLIVSLTQPLGRSLPDRQAAGFLGYDLVQVTLLLYLTGGLHNPFSVLILAPVTVSATVLSRGSTIGLGLLAGLCITILGLWHEPFPWQTPGFALPDFYLMGVWQALVVATLFIAAYVGSVSEEATQMSGALTATQFALAREQQISQLGALAAAAAHELGSPLATITLVAKEMGRDLPEDSPLAEDVALLIEQTERCRDILAQLSQTPEREAPFARVGLMAQLDLAATPNAVDGVGLVFDGAPDPDTPDSPEPQFPRHAEFQHGVGTIVQNAAQFARTEVRIAARWSADTVRIEIVDDGPGFAPNLLDRLGEPYLSTRAGPEGDGEHMGLGLFIAQNLLSRLGCRITFTNGAAGGARVALAWSRADLEGPPEATEHE